VESEDGLEDGRQKELKRLAENYAIRAREFCDAVAALGARISTGKSLASEIAEIEVLRILCERLGSDLLAYVKALETGNSQMTGAMRYVKATEPESNSPCEQARPK